MTVTGAQSWFGGRTGPSGAEPSPLGHRIDGMRRSPGPATLRHHDDDRTLRRADFGRDAHAYALLDSYVYGFALQEAAMPFQHTAADVTEPIMQRFRTDQYPHLVEMATEYILQPGYDFGDEFEFGLGVILDALTRWQPRNTSGIQPTRPGEGLLQSPAGRVDN